MKPPVPVRLQWDFSDPKLATIVDEAYLSARKIIDVSGDLDVFLHF